MCGAAVNPPAKRQIQHENHPGHSQLSVWLTVHAMGHIHLRLPVDADANAEFGGFEQVMHIPIALLACNVLCNCRGWHGRVVMMSPPPDTATPPECTVDLDCNDNNACTDDTCSAGKCAHATVPNCPATTDCKVSADCPDPGVGSCQTAACAAGKCQALPSPDGLPCDDGDVCTAGDDTAFRSR